MQRKNTHGSPFSTLTAVALGFCLVVAIALAWQTGLFDKIGGANPQTATAESWENIRISNDPQAVAKYLSDDPNSPHATEALELLNALLADQSDQTVTRAATDIISPVPANGLSSFVLSSEAIELLVTESPQFAPIEGLRAELWQTKMCKDCHQWSAQDLCRQAETYTHAGFDPKTDGLHPLGIPFKLSMKSWAEKGCP